MIYDFSHMGKYIYIAVSMQYRHPVLAFLVDGFEFLHLRGYVYRPCG